MIVFESYIFQGRFIMKILLARQYKKNDEFSLELESELQRRYIKAEIVQRYTKDDVLELLKKDNTFTVLVLEEYLQQYLPTDIDFLDDLLNLESKLNIVFIASNEHKSKKRLIESLYNAGIYNLLFEEDVDVKNIVNLIINQRNDKAAKIYMGLDYDEETVLLSQSTPSTINYSEEFDDSYEKEIPRELYNNIDEKIVTKAKVIKKEIVKHVYSIPQDYKKVIAIVGFENSGATTIAVNLSYALSKNNIKTTLIDTDYIRKDIYYHFSKDYFGCMSKIKDSQDCFKLGQPINKYLTVFSEHYDVEYELRKDSLFKLLGQAKRNSDIVVVDISSNLKEEVIKSLLEFSDNILIVANQNINKLYRVSKQILRYKQNILSAQLVVNKYIDRISHLDKNSISKNFFQELRGEKNDFNRGINEVFIVRDDLSTILEGLAERKPAISMKECVFEQDVNEIANFYYRKEVKKRGLYNQVIDFFKNN